MNEDMQYKGGQSIPPQPPKNEKKTLAIVLGIIFGCLALFVIMAVVILYFIVFNNPKAKIAKGFEKTYAELSNGQFNNEFGISEICDLVSNGNTKTTFTYSDTVDITGELYKNTSDKMARMDINYDLNTINLYADESIVMTGYADELLYINYRDDLAGQLKNSETFSYFYEDYSEEEIDSYCDNIVNNMDIFLSAKNSMKLDKQYANDLNKTYDKLYKAVKVEKSGKQTFDVDGKSKDYMVYKVFISDEDLDNYIKDTVDVINNYEPEALTSLAEYYGYDLENEYEYFIDSLKNSFDEVEFNVALDGKGRIIYFAYSGYIDYYEIDAEVKLKGGSSLFANMEASIKVDNETELIFDITDSSTNSDIAGTLYINMSDAYESDDFTFNYTVNKASGDLTVLGKSELGEEILFNGNISAKNGKKILLNITDFSCVDEYGEEKTSDLAFSLEVVEYNNSIEKPQGDENDLLAMTNEELTNLLYKILYGSSDFDNYDYDFEE